jgi:hypothetical protein
VAVVAAMALGRAGHWDGECWCDALALVEEGLRGYHARAALRLHLLAVAG